MLIIKMQQAALAAAGALALTACGGGGGSDSAGPVEGPRVVDAFAYTQPIAATLQDTAEPASVDQIVLSTSDTDEPDTRL